MRLSLLVVELSLDFLLLLAADNFPALVLGNRAALLDPHDIAHRISVGFVMGVVLLRAANRFLHRWVRKTTLHTHDHRLILLVAHHNAMERTLRHLEPLIPSTLSWRATFASQWLSVWAFWSSLWPPARRQLSAPAQAHRHASAPLWSSCAQCRVGLSARERCSRADRWPAGSAG